MISNNTYTDNQNEIEKVLPMSPPFITAYSTHSSFISILMNYEHTLPWVYNYFIQLTVDKNLYGKLDFCIGDGFIINGCPWLIYHGISRSLAQKKWTSITKMIIDCINENEYIYIMVDEFYLSVYNHAYQEAHLPHGLMIYGYNIENKEFYVCDNFTNGKFGFLTCSFSEVEAGYNNYLSISHVNGLDPLEGIRSYSINNNAKYDFDINLVIDLLDDYINSKNSNLRFRSINHHINDLLWVLNNDFFKCDWVFGLDVYKTLIDNIDNNYESVTRLDIRHFHCLYDHKIMILRLIHYLCRENYIKPEIADCLYEKFLVIKQKALLIRNLVLKFNISTNRNILRRIINEMLFIEQLECSLLTNLRNDISQTGDIFFVSSISNKCVKKFSPAILYTNVWDSITDDEGSEMKPASTNTINARAKFMFWGSSIIYYATKSNQCGIVDVYIDNMLDTSVDLYSDSMEHNKKVYFKDNLPLGYHSICLSHTGRRNRNALNASITLNSFETNYNIELEQNKNSIKFFMIDTETKGNWNKIYGTEGYNIPNQSSKYPNYIEAFHISTPNKFTWDDDTDDVRALENITNIDKRLASCYFHNEKINIDIITTGSNQRFISFYLLNWGKGIQEIKIRAYDGDSGEILESRVVESCNEGVYVIFSIKGYVKFEFINITDMPNANALCSGIFFGFMKG